MLETRAEIPVGEIGIENIEVETAETAENKVETSVDEQIEIEIIEEDSIESEGEENAE